jgi:hypothetical protein
MNKETKKNVIKAIIMIMVVISSSIMVYLQCQMDKDHGKVIETTHTKKMECNGWNIGGIGKIGKSECYYYIYTIETYEDGHKKITSKKWLMNETYNFKGE